MAEQDFPNQLAGNIARKMTGMERIQPVLDLIQALMPSLEGSLGIGQRGGNAQSVPQRGPLPRIVPGQFDPQTGEAILVDPQGQALNRSPAPQATQAQQAGAAGGAGVLDLLRILLGQ